MTVVVLRKNFVESVGNTLGPWRFARAKSRANWGVVGNEAGGGALEPAACRSRAGRSKNISGSSWVPAED